MLKKSLILFLILMFALSACRSNLPERSSANYAEAVKSFYIGLAAMQAANDERAKEELNKTVNLAGDEPAGWANLGILEMRQKDFEASAASLEKAKNLAPDNAQIYTNIAVLEIQRGNFEKAAQNLQKAAEIDPNDSKTHYALAREYERQNDDARAAAEYEKILRIKPDNLPTLLEVVRLAAKRGETEKLKTIFAQIAPRTENWDAEVKEQFSALEKAADNPREVSRSIAFFRNVLLRLPEFRSEIAAVKFDDTIIGEPFIRPLKLPAPDFSPAEPDLALTFSAQPLENVKAKFAKAIFLNGENPPVVAWSNEKETRVGKASLPVSVSNSNEICAFDFDYDFKNDLAVATEKGFRLFKQTDGESFTDVTANTKIPSEILRKEYAGVWTFDVESDGDLDLILSAKGAESIVLQNNADGTFKQVPNFPAMAGLVYFVSGDFDEDGDGDGAIIEALGYSNSLINERGGLFKRRDTHPGPAEKTGAIAVGDANGDGRVDILELSSEGALELITDNNNGKDWEHIELFRIGRKPEHAALFIADADNNGANDILISNDMETQIFLAGKDGKFALANNKINSQISSVAETNGDGKLDLIGIDADGKPVVFQNKSAKNYHWQILRPRAAKTEGDQRVNSFGIGGETEIRSGLLAQKQIITSPQVHFGLGENASADVLRVVWANGYTQAEFDIKTDQIIAAEQRLKGSCPHLFAWNGEKFEMVKDAPPWSPALGLKINAQDTYGILQTEEWFKIPGDALKAKDGSYELRITGEYWEAYYIDNYQLLAVDHPENTEVFTDERFSIPLPPLKVFTTEKTRGFISAKNDKGEDVSEIVQTLDEKYLDGFKRGTFQGVAGDHFVELELPDDAPKDKKIWIVADGWVHPTDASINVQLGQSSKEKPKSLSLEVQDEGGNWKIAKENLGFPAGKMKTVLIDLPRGAKRFRLRTNMEIFWDKLAWSVDLSSETNRQNRLPLAESELRHRGFSVMEKLDDSSPEKPVYDKILTTGQRWRDLEGYFTRFGDVKELLAAVDDRYVLMNAGDELVLRFPALPDVQAGWKRDFVIIGNGWIKDGDLNSVFSKTLLPLPTHVTNDYSRPPTRLKDDPVYQKNKSDWMNFHTRYVAPDLFRNALR